MWLLLVMLMKETDHRDKEVGKPIYTYIINLKVTLSGCLSHSACPLRFHG